MCGRARRGDRTRCQLITEPVNPWNLLAQVSSVYVVSSQLGFDALAEEKKVRCFGMPFYAGWGLSQDERSCARRTGFQPSIEQLAYAAYDKYCRFLDPYSGNLSDFESTAQTLKHLSSIAQKTADLGPFLGIFPWNQKTLRSMFQLYRTEHQFAHNAKKALQLASQMRRPVSAWSSRLKPEMAAKCAEKSIPLFRLEDGFVRSVGLGSNFHQPMSLVLDRTGIYYNSSAPSDLETLLNNFEFDDELNLLKDYFIGDEEEIKKLMEQVANQAKAK